MKYVSTNLFIYIYTEELYFSSSFLFLPSLEQSTFHTQNSFRGSQIEFESIIHLIHAYLLYVIQNKREKNEIFNNDKSRESSKFRWRQVLYSNTFCLLDGYVINDLGRTLRWANPIRNLQKWKQYSGWIFSSAFQQESVGNYRKDLQWEYYFHVPTSFCRTCLT